MSLKEIDFKSEYRSNSSNDPKNFYKECYINSKKFRRASGYFSSNIYDLFKPEILTFITNGGSLELICSQVLSKEDIQSISEGYKQKNELMEKSISEEVEKILNDNEAIEEVDFVATLVKFNKLKIKVVFYLDGSGIFHEKTGYFIDEFDNIVSFSGSANESYSGMSGTGNFERIKVFKSWEESEKIQIENDMRLVDNIWENNEEGLDTIDFPEVPKTFFLERAKNNFDEFSFSKIKEHTIKKTKIDNLEDYQQEAITNWENKNFRGILKHATGSGKTITSLHALNKHISNGLPCIVLVPSQLLLNQWFIEINNEIHEPIILRCGAGFVDWKKKGFFQNILSKVSGIKGGILLAVMDTASQKDFQKRLFNFENILLIVDEVHAVGSPNHLSILEYNYKKRLGLSATPERYNDPDGTKKIMDFFDGIVKPIITIKHAIEKGRLVNYDYFPTQVHLNAEEENQWIELTEKIIQHLTFNNNKSSDTKSIKEDKYLQNLLIQRSRIAKKASNKSPLAVDIINKNYQKDEFWLVYCEDQEQLKIIDQKLKENGHNPFIYISSLEEKSEELKEYKKNGGILLSIRCLDEGIDIPQISHAVIAASSQNPRQFIQRRGRVLRKFENKIKATIFDFFTVPNLPQTKFNGLIKNEFLRGIEFAITALNAREADSTLRQILIKMNIDPNDLIDDLDVEENE